jgi:ferric-dicitrate binding protein FerR (iron transport regulator)
LQISFLAPVEIGSFYQVIKKGYPLSKDSRLRADAFPDSAGEIERLRQEVKSLQAENAALRRMKAKAPRRRSWGGFLLKYLIVAAFVGAAVFSAMNRNQTIEKAFEQINRALP